MRPELDSLNLNVDNDYGLKTFIDVIKSYSQSLEYTKTQLQSYSNKQKISNDSKKEF